MLGWRDKVEEVEHQKFSPQIWQAKSITENKQEVPVNADLNSKDIDLD